MAWGDADSSGNGIVDCCCCGPDGRGGVVVAGIDVLPLLPRK